MSKPKIFKQGGHLTTDPGIFEDDEDTEHLTRTQVLKKVDEKTIKNGQHDQTIDDSFPASDSPSSGKFT